MYHSRENIHIFKHCQMSMISCLKSTSPLPKPIPLYTPHQQRETRAPVGVLFMFWSLPLSTSDDKTQMSFPHCAWCLKRVYSPRGLPHEWGISASDISVCSFLETVLPNPGAVSPACTIWRPHTASPQYRTAM